MRNWLLSALVLSSSLLLGRAPDERKIVYVDVVGDLPHAGHVEFYKKAKEFGDYLIVGVLSDENVATYKRVPILTLAERVALVSALRVVDEVIADAPLHATREWLEEHAVDVVVHGDDANEVMLREQYSAAIEMGIFRLVPYTQGISTTDIMGRIQSRLEKERDRSLRAAASQSS